MTNQAKNRTVYDSLWTNSIISQHNRKYWPNCIQIAWKLHFAIICAHMPVIILISSRDIYVGSTWYGTIIILLQNSLEIIRVAVTSWRHKVLPPCGKLSKHWHVFLPGGHAPYGVIDRSSSLCHRSVDSMAKPVSLCRWMR